MQRLINADYWEQEPKEAGWVLTWFWEVVVKFYLEKGWLDLAFEVVVGKDEKFGLSDELRMVLLDKLEESGDARRASVFRVSLERSAVKEVST